MGDISSHFSISELACPCCGKYKGNGILIRKLEKLRQLAGDRPIEINSGTRCFTHNAEVGGAEDSQHLYGTAVDISIEGLSPQYVADLMEQAGFDGIGVYETFTHGDVRGAYARW